jgi:lysosomal alpha-mannosidase
MNDEACPHYEDILNNMQVGHQFVLEQFGKAPRIGWHVDPFGHSNAQPRLFAEMGFDAWFFARLDYQDKEKRLQEKSMEWVWRPFYALYQHYSAPNGFCFDVRCNDDPFVDDITLETYNADLKVAQFYDWVMHMKEHYQTNHLFITMGDDFCYMNAQMYFQSMDKLITHFNAKYPNITLLYSTPSDYIDAIKSLDVEWPTKYDDMFPYADAENSFWTGYFTSRANDKSFIRRGSHNLMASSKVYALKAID